MSRISDFSRSTSVLNKPLVVSDLTAHSGISENKLSVHVEMDVVGMGAVKPDISNSLD